MACTFDKVCFHSISHHTVLTFPRHIYIFGVSPPDTSFCYFSSSVLVREHIWCYFRLLRFNVICHMAQDLSEWMSLCLGKLLLFQYPVSSVLHGSQGCCTHASSLLQFFCERLRGWCRVPTVVMRSLTYSRRTQVLVGILCSVIRTHLRSVLPWFLFFITRKDLLLGIVYSEISLE